MQETPQRDVRRDTEHALNPAMVVAIARFCEYQGSMTEQELSARILELEQQLLTANEAVAKLALANEAVAKLTLSNAELTKQLSSADTQNKKLKRTSRRDESSLRQQLTVAQSRRF